MSPSRLASIPPKIVVSDKKGKIYRLSHLEAAGMKGGLFFRLNPNELVKLPYGSEIFMLPDRMPLGYDPKKKDFVVLKDYYAVAAFLSPGYTITHNASYVEMKRAKLLPLFSYGAVASYKGEFYAACVMVDRQKRHDLRHMKINLVRKGIKKLKKLYPQNRIIRHLENCALIYGCPNAKNFFLSKYEAPLPSSPYCNAECIGCISYQPDKKCPPAQPRIKFIPTASEIAETALYHIKNVKDPIVSFGQGCEGEPLLADKILEESIKLIRKKTNKGMINLNTNASRPRILEKLLEAGLNSVRVSLNSAREDFYARYFKPEGYGFRDVLDSIKTAKRKKAFVSINYLVMPGFTDSKGEFSSLTGLIKKYKVDMLQLRNLNYDPLDYFRRLEISPERQEMLGIKEIIRALEKSFPRLMLGYFNPSKASVKYIV